MLFVLIPGSQSCTMTMLFRSLLILVTSLLALQPKTCASSLGRADPENPCASCNCYGPCGPRGPTGDAGEEGVQGYPGVIGLAGEPGTNGVTLSGEATLALLNERMEYLNPNGQNQAVTLPSLYLQTGAYQWLSDTTVSILQSGTYQAFYHANPQYVNNLYLMRNGLVVPGSVFGLPLGYVSAVNDMEIFGQVIVDLEVGDELELWVKYDGVASNTRMNANYKNSASLLLLQLTVPEALP